MKWSKTIELRATPPSLKQNILERERLAFQKVTSSGATLIDLSAPQGYGRTVLLAQWYAQANEAGAASIWVSMDGLGDPTHFVQALTLASARHDVSLAKSNFADWVAETSNPIEVLTGWILEVQQSASNYLLILDDADLVPEGPLFDAMTFAIANAPGNLRIALATRPGHPIFRQPAFFGTPLMRLTAKDLRFTTEETEALTRQSFFGEEGSTLGQEVHRLTDGWPLGIQLALITRSGNGTSHSAEQTVTHALGQYFTDSIIDRLPDDVLDMLITLAHLDPINYSLAKAVTADTAPLEALEPLADTTPLFVRADSGHWMRLHPAARDLLIGKQAGWPEARRQACARDAATWYAQQGLFEEAADQARIAGDTDMALDLAANAMREMKVKGRSADVMHWVDTLPAGELEKHPDFWLAAAWAFVNFNHSDRLPPLLRLMREWPDRPEVYHAEIDLIEAAMAANEDDLEALNSFAKRWPHPLEIQSPDQRLIHTLLIATKTKLSGQPALARSIIEQASELRATSKTGGFVRALAETYRGSATLWEGKPRLAFDFLQSALEQAEGELNRRNSAVTGLAALMAFASVEMKRFDTARKVLSGRLPLIEKSGVPDTMIFGYQAAARLSEAENRVDLAEVQLEGLITIGQARGLPRVEASGLWRLVRLHMRHGHTSLARQFADRLQTLSSQLPKGTARPIRDIVDLFAQIALASLPASEGPNGLLEAARRARALAQTLRRGRDQVMAQGLIGRALLLAGDGRGQRDLQEAMATAHSRSLSLLHDELKNNNNERASVWNETPKSEDLAPKQEPHPGILTAREQDVLVGIAAHMGNKEIALTLGLSDETVKWHLKNLFQKLDASDRKIAVGRARMLGIL